MPCSALLPVVLSFSARLLVLYILHLTKQVVTLKDGKTQNKALISKEQMFNLIKAGCFDNLEPNKTRLDLLEEYIHLEHPDKTSLTTANIDALINRGLIPEEYLAYAIIGIYVVLFIAFQIISSAIRKARKEKIENLKKTYEN